jgi:hypothetical protein
MKLRTIFALAAFAAVQVYLALLPHEHPCPPCDHSVYMERIAELERQVAAQPEPLVRDELADALKRLATCEYKWWLQNGDHGHVK